MIHHRHGSGRFGKSSLNRTAAIGLLFAGLCSSHISLAAKQPDTPDLSSSSEAGLPGAFHALAVNQDYVGIWMTAGADNEEAAKRRALDLCVRDTGANTCQIAHSGQRNHLAVGYASDGGLEFLAQHEVRGLAEALEAKCVGRFGSTCMVIGVVGPDGSKDFPANPTPAPRRRYAAIAGDFVNAVNGRPYHWRAWVVAGAETREAAKQAAMASCEQEIGQSRCQLAEANGNSVLLFYQAKEWDSASGFLSEKSPDRAVAEMNRRCRLADRDCQAISMISAQDPAQFAVELGASPEAKIDAPAGGGL